MSIRQLAMSKTCHLSHVLLKCFILLALFFDQLGKVAASHRPPTGGSKAHQRPSFRTEITGKGMQIDVVKDSPGSISSHSHGLSISLPAAEGLFSYRARKDDALEVKAFELKEYRFSQISNVLKLKGILKNVHQIQYIEQYIKRIRNHERLKPLSKSHNNEGEMTLEGLREFLNVLEQRNETSLPQSGIEVKRTTVSRQSEVDIGEVASVAEAKAPGRVKYAAAPEPSGSTGEMLFPMDDMNA